jgi:hypothetical protein
MAESDTEGDGLLALRPRCRLRERLPGSIVAAGRQLEEAIHDGEHWQRFFPSDSFAVVCGYLE